MILDESKRCTYGQWVGITIVLVLLGVLYSGLIESQVLGLIHDDGVYTITAKALAHGKGYSLIHLLSTPPQIKYPIVFPLLLSIAWLINPVFPQNIPLLTFIPVIFSIAGFGVLFYYLRQVRHFPTWLALSVVMLCSWHFYAFKFYTRVMSEGPYLFFSLLTLTYAEKNLSQLTPKRLALLINLSIITFHTRVVGIFLILAIGCTMWLKKQKKTAALYTSISGLLTLGLWQGWGWLNHAVFQSPLTNRYINYGLEWNVNLQQTGFLLKVLLSIQIVLNHIAALVLFFYRNSAEFFGLDSLESSLFYQIALVVLAYVLALYYILGSLRALKSHVISISALYLVFHLIFLAIWGYPEQIARFMVVLAPLLWMHFLQPLLPTLESKRGKSVFIFLLLIPNLLSATLEYATLHQERLVHLIEKRRYPHFWDDYQAVFQYINTHLESNAVIAAERDVVFYLYTNRLTYGLHLPGQSDLTEANLNPYLKSVLDDMTRKHVQYIVVEPHLANQVVVPTNETSGELVAHYPERFKLRYTSPQQLSVVLELLPEASASDSGLKTPAAK